MKTLLTAVLVLINTALFGATTNITYGWDYPVTPGTGFLFYEIQAGNIRVLQGGSISNRFTLMNRTVGTQIIVTVVATNFWGTSEDATPYVIPIAPTKPANLAPVTFIFPSVPVPGVLELSTDLINWDERLRLKANSTVELVQIPFQPMLYGRIKPAIVVVSPPIP